MAAIAIGMAAVGLAACQPAPPQPVHFENVPVASWRAEGDGRVVLVVGSTVYVGGTYTTVRSPDGATVVNRGNLAAFDLVTGALRTTFVANTDGTVEALATDGTRLYVGGSFRHVNGVARARLAAVDLTTGAVATGWQADADSNVYALAVAGDRLVVGGSFSDVDGVARSRAAAVRLTDAAVTSWAPAANGTVISAAASPDGTTAYLGGSFSTVNGHAAQWLAKIDGTGALVPVTWQDLQGPALDVEVNADGTRLAVAQGGAGNQGSWYDATTGTRYWRQRCDGDGQAIHIIDGSVLTGFHEACDGDGTQRLTSNASADGVRDLELHPSFDRFWGVYGIDGNALAAVIAGDFTNISGVPVQGFAIFPHRDVPPPPLSLPSNSTWRYLDDGTDPGTAWRQPGFDDGAWASGPAQLGFGDGDEATVVSYGPDPNHKYISTYFRTTFTASAVPQSLTLHLLADDGAVVYLNGVEVARDNMPAGTITSSTRAASNRSGSAETVAQTFALSPGSVVVGTNTIAVEVHQDAPSSSDLSFWASLEAS